MILIEGNGDVCLSVLIKMQSNHQVDGTDIVLNTSQLHENAALLAHCEQNNIVCFSRNYDDDFITFLKSKQLKYCFSVKGRRILPITKLGVSCKNTFNFHPSLLPALKGCFSVPWAIILGYETSGYSIHQMVDSVDEGMIWLQQEVPISQYDSSYTYYAKIIDSFVLSFDQFFTNFMSKQIKAFHQSGKASYKSRLLPHDGYINVNWDGAYVERFIRAMRYPPYRGALFLKNGIEYEIENFQKFEELKLID